MSGAELATVAVAFAWIGLVLGLSFLETPLKFRAPGITLALGLGIGRLVFTVLGRVEAVLVVLLTLGACSVGAPALAQAAIAGLWAVVLVQRFAVRPRLMRRTDAVLAGHDGPRSLLHVWFVGLDLVKLVLLAAVGCSVGLNA